MGINADVVVVNHESSTKYPSNCARVCSGTTGRQTTDWQNYGFQGVYIDVDISDCGFVNVPTVTTTLEGRSCHYVQHGTSSVYGVASSGFRMYVVPDKSWLNCDDFEKRGQWNVEWTAIGYTCRPASSLP